MHWRYAVPIAALALSAFMLPAVAEPLIGRASVIDGDTLEIHSTRVRLEGIDAPESRQICIEKIGQVDQFHSGQLGPIERQKIPSGRRAAFFLADLIGAKPVTCTPDGVDRYRRVLAHCTVDGADIGRALVRAGWALAYTKYSTEYSADEEAARRAGAGLWAMEFIAPWEWRAGRRSKEQIRQ
jgi:endonuclease YncB( thermonuclease family)